MKLTTFTVQRDGDETRISARSGNITYVCRNTIIKAVDTEEEPEATEEYFMVLPTFIFEQMGKMFPDKPITNKTVKVNYQEAEREALKNHIADQNELINKLLSKWT